jgi:hypothetical protein
VNNFLCPSKAAKQPTVHGSKRTLPIEEIGKRGRHPSRCCRMEHAALITEQNTKLGPADAGGILQHGLEHRFELAGRAGNDAQHLSGRILPRNRFV